MGSYFVVYQFGKVASTSIVSALNTLPDVKAVQTHFLGRERFVGMLDIILDPRESDYFTEHRQRQLFRNIDIMREITRYQKGLVETGSLIFLSLSLSREPVDRFRSAIIQDIEGYLPLLKGFQEAEKLIADNDAESVEAGLSRSLSMIVDLLDEIGGVDVYLRNRAGYTDLLESVSGGNVAQTNKLVRTLFDLYLRPFGWFDHHYKSLLGVDPSEMKQIASFVFKSDDENGVAYVIRYEDLSRSLAVIMQDLGFDKDLVLKRKNAGREKKFYENVTNAFTPAITESLRQVSRAKYQTMFGYT